MSSATYRTLLRAPAAAFFLTAPAGRVGIAMTSLGIVRLVHARTGSYATAGLVTGGFAVAEAVGRTATGPAGRLLRPEPDAAGSAARRIQVMPCCRARLISQNLELRLCVLLRHSGTGRPG